MSNDVYTGFWTGEIKGTNTGGITFTIDVNDNKVTGEARIHEPALGQYQYFIAGEVNDGLHLKLTPGWRESHLELGMVEVICKLDASQRLVGKWESTIGTVGAFIADKFDDSAFRASLPKNNAVFLVHGRDAETKLSVARFLEKLEIEPFILQEQLNKGMTLIEKFQNLAERAGFAIVIMTPDDYGYLAGDEENKKHRARQNVILELGYFTALLGREKTMVLVKGDIELPSDVFGVAYEPIDGSEGWKIRLARELKAAGFDVDLNKAI